MAIDSIHTKYLDKKFFGYTPEYKKGLLEEVYVMVRYLGFSYSDVMTMPVYQRKFFLQMAKDDAEKKNSGRSENQSNVGGKRTKSGIDGRTHPDVKKSMKKVGPTKN